MWPDHTQELPPMAPGKLSLRLLQWCRSKSTARGDLLIVRGGSFLVCIFIRNFEAKSMYLYKQMIMLSRKEHSFTTLYIVIWRFLDSFSTKIAFYNRTITHMCSNFQKIYRVWEAVPLSSHSQGALPPSSTPLGSCVMCCSVPLLTST